MTKATKAMIYLSNALALISSLFCLLSLYQNLTIFHLFLCPHVHNDREAAVAARAAIER